MRDACSFVSWGSPHTAMSDIGWEAQHNSAAKGVIRTRIADGLCVASAREGRREQRFSNLDFKDAESLC